jgi:hypothetical protein
MKHQVNEERLALFLRGDLSGVDRRAVAQHVATCAECQSTLEDLSRSHELLIGSFEDPTPAELTAVRSAVAWRIRTQSRRPAWRIWAIAASAVVAGILVLANLPPQTDAPRRPVASAAAPVPIRISPPPPRATDDTGGAQAGRAPRSHNDAIDTSRAAGLAKDKHIRSECCDSVATQRYEKAETP